MLNTSQATSLPKNPHKDLDVYLLLSNTAHKQPNKVGGRKPKKIRGDYN